MLLLGEPKFQQIIIHIIIIEVLIKRYKEIKIKEGHSEEFYKYIAVHGHKLHLLGFLRIGKLPHPEQQLFTPALANDLTVFRKPFLNSCFPH